VTGRVTVSVRPAVAEDTGAIAALEAELFPGSAWSEAQVLEELTGYGRRGWVVELRQSPGPGDASGAEIGAKGAVTGVSAALLRGVVGYVVMRTVGDVSDLQRIGVAPVHQRHGLAARLLGSASAGVREQGAERILLEVAEDNGAAQAFYAGAGFVEIDRRPRYYRHEVDALVLEKRLEE
jgi:ribosomal-protein-alanine N-acetyltransferase